MFTIVPDLESVRCFVAVATHGHFGDAARVVALSTSAVSQRVARLERDLGVSLFSRTTRRVVLTAEGTRALPIARRLLAEARGFVDAVTEGDTRPYELTLATRFELGLSWLTPALTTLEKALPERRIHLSFGDSDDMTSRVKSGHVDAAVTSSRVIPSGLRYELLHDEEYAFVASAALLRQRPLDGARQAPDHVLLDIGPDLPLFRYFLDADRGAASWSFGEVRHLGTIGAIRLRVLAGAGVAVLPSYFVGRDVERGRLVRVAPRVRLKKDAFRLLWPEDHPLEAELRQLAAELRQLPLR